MSRKLLMGVVALLATACLPFGGADAAVEECREAGGRWLTPESSDPRCDYTYELRVACLEGGGSWNRMTSSCRHDQ